MKIKNYFFIFVVVLTIGILLEYKNLGDNGSLIISNIKQDISYYRGSVPWVTRYNEAIWLAKSGKYIQAKTLISPLLNDTTLPKKAEISEFYGDLIYNTSGSIDDSIRMYERSLSFKPNDRIKEKIAYIQKNRTTKTQSGSISKALTSSGIQNSGSLEKNIKKEELQKIGQKRADFLSNYAPSNDESQKDIKKLIELSTSEEVQFNQDW